MCCLSDFQQIQRTFEKLGKNFCKVPLSKIPTRLLSSLYWVLFATELIFFFVVIYFLILHHNQSFFSLLFPVLSPTTSLFAPLMPHLPFPHCSLQIHVGLPQISVNHVISSYSETRHLLFYYGWVRQSGRRNESQRQASESETTPALPVRSLTGTPNHTTVANMQKV